jgi:hypothetical protein
MNEDYRNHEDPQAIVPYAGSDGWDAVPETSFGLIRGRITLYNINTKDYLVDKQTVMNGRVLVVVGVVTAWVRWDDKKPREHRITAPGQRHPDRDELSHFNKELWEIGIDGKPLDPWRDTRYLYLIDPQTGEEFTFVTSIIRGHVAISELSRQIANARSAHPGAVPVVQLDSGPWQTQYGMQSRPCFTVVGWRQGSAPQRMQEPPKHIATIAPERPAPQSAPNLAPRRTYYDQPTTNNMDDDSSF